MNICKFLTFANKNDSEVNRKQLIHIQKQLLERSGKIFFTITYLKEMNSKRILNNIKVTKEIIKLFSYRFCFIKNYQSERHLLYHSPE